MGVAAVSGMTRRELADVAPTSALPPQRASIAWGGLLTAAVWLLSRFIDSVTWGPARNPISFNPYLWARWDSANYLGIAQHGRTFGRCGSPGFPQNSFNNLLHQTWCGSAGWLPGFPWLTRAVGVTGISLPDAGLLISWLAMGAAFFLVWFGWGRDIPQGRAFALLMLFGVFPGSVYSFAYFPISLALACIVGALVAAARERFFTAAVLMSLAGLCYPSAWFAAAGLAVGLVLAALSLGWTVLIRRVLWGVAGMSSLLVLGIHDQLAFGHFDAFFIMDSGPGLRARGFPGEDYLRLVFTHHTNEQRRLGRFGGAVLAVQGVAALLLVAWAAASAVGRNRRQDAARLYPALVGVAVIIGIMVDAANGGAWNRSVLLAAPCVVCLRRVPLPVLCVVVVVVGATSAVISHYFFTYALV
jgi:hypothetical protein